MSAWEILGLNPTSDKRQIKKAYVKLLKQNNPEDDPKGFQALREAYDQALRDAEGIQSNSNPELDSNPSENLKPSGAQHSPSEFNEAFSILNSYPQEAYPSPSKEPEHIQIRNEQIERVNQAVRAVGLSLKIDEDEAIERCKLQLADEYFQALDVLYRYEGELLREVYQRKEFPFRFVSFMAEVFEWNTEVHGYIKPSSIFDDDADYYPAFVRVYRYFIFEHTKRDILNNYRRNLPPSKTASEVEDILLSEYDESRLNTFKHSASHRGILYKLVAYIKARNYDKLDLSPIPYETYQWLEHNNILHNPKTRSSGNSDERSSKGFTWGVFILIFITIQLVVFLSRDDSPDYSSYDQNRRDEWLKEATDQKTYDEFKQQIPSTKVKLEGFDRSSAIPSDSKAPSPIGNDLKEEHSRLILPEKYKPSFRYGTVHLLDTSRYEGEQKDNTPHGNGTMHYANGDRFTGQFEYGVRTEGLFSSKNGERFEGKFVNDQYSEGKYIWKNGESFEGTFSNGKYHIGNYSWPNGKSLKAEFKEGQPIAPLTWQYADGSTLHIERVEGDLQFGTYTSADGNSHHGSFLKGEKHGPGSASYANGDNFTGEFNKGKKIQGEYQWKNGNKFKGLFNNNQPAHGEYYSAKEASTYHGEILNGKRTGSGTLEIKGLIYKGNFINAQLHGEGEMLDDRGYTYRGEFSKGLREGRFTVIAPNGTQYRTTFKNDKQMRELSKVSD